MLAPPELRLEIDVGCGNAKRPGFVGWTSSRGADHLCDLSLEPLPFSDGSVDHLFSSHCLEHIPPDRLAHVFREFTRVAVGKGPGGNSARDLTGQTRGRP